MLKLQRNLCCLLLAAGLIHTPGISMAQTINEDELANVLAYYDSLDPSSLEPNTFDTNSESSSVRVYTAPATQSYDPYSIYSGGGSSVYGGFQAEPGLATTGGVNIAPATTTSTTVYSAGQSLRSDPGGGIGGTVIRRPLSIVPQSQVLLRSGGGVNQAPGGNAGGNPMFGPPNSLNKTQSFSQDMTQEQKMDWAASVSPTISSLLDEMSEAESKVLNAGDNVDPQMIQQREEVMAKVQNMVEIASIIDEMVTKTMQTQSAQPSTFQPQTYRRPLAVEGPNFWFQSR